MLKLIFQDDSLMVFDKPAGLVVTSTQTHQEPTLEDILRSEYKIKIERSGIVHRLDKDTSGLIVVGKSDESVLALQSQFKAREVSKEYLALVHGNIEKPGRVEASIGRNPGDREKFVVFEDYQIKNGVDLNVREAVTEYEPDRLLVMSSQFIKQIFADFSKIQLRKLQSMNYQQFTLLRCHPLTGRTHQIRVHLKYIGHPIVGDSKYGGRKVVRYDHRWCPRQFLHAARLEFTHPSTALRMSFESELPGDLEKALGKLSVLS